MAPYVRDGRVLRDAGPSSLSCTRLALWTIILVVLIVTNPANKAREWPEKARDAFSLLLSSSSWGDSRGFGGGEGVRYYSAEYDPPRRRRGEGGGSYDDFWDAVDSVSYRLFGSDLSSALFGDGNGGVGSSGLGGGVGGARATMTTNYILYSLERDYAGVNVAALNGRFRLCTLGFGEERGELGPSLCNWVDGNLCHGMKVFDPKNRAFTVHRTLECLVLLGSVLSLISTYKGRSGASLLQLTRSPLAVLLSPLSDPDLFGDLLSLNVFVYPALMSVERTMLGWRGAEGVATPEDTARYYLACAALMFGVGAASNLAASMFLGGREVGGTRGAAAAALGYGTVAFPARVAVAYWGVQMTSSDVLLAVSAVGMLSCASRSSVGPWRWDGGTVAAWISGGVMGTFFAEALRERYGGGGWFSFH